MNCECCVVDECDRTFSLLVPSFFLSTFVKTNDKTKESKSSEIGGPITTTESYDPSQIRLDLSESGGILFESGGNILCKDRYKRTSTNGQVPAFGSDYTSQFVELCNGAKWFVSNDKTHANRYISP